MSTRAKLAAAFVLSLVVTLAAFQFTQDPGQRILIGLLAFIPFVIAVRTLNR